MRYYSRNQMILILFSFLAVLYTCFFYIQDSKLEKSGRLTTLKVVNQGCRNSKGSSSVHISYNGKIYYVRLANKECLKYPVGSKISLIYNHEFDYFYVPDGLMRDKYRLFFTLGFLFLSVIPWKSLVNKLSLKR